MATNNEMNNPVTTAPDGPPTAGEYAGGAVRGALGMAVTGAVVLAAAGAAVAAAVGYFDFDMVNDLLKAVSPTSVQNAISGLDDTLIDAGMQLGKTPFLAMSGAITGAAAGAILGAPAGAMAGMLGVKQKYVEEQVIPQVATVALNKGVEIGRVQQKTVDMAEMQVAHAQAGVMDDVKEKPVLGKWTQAAVNEQANRTLATMAPVGNA